MSQIKFRALIGNDLMFWDLQDMCGPHRFSMRQIICPWLMEGNQPDRFTGLQDKNGADIFEGDIVTHYDVGDVEEVYWNEDELCFACRGGTSESWLNSGYQVIGNIHQHSALLQEAKS